LFEFRINKIFFYNTPDGATVANLCCKLENTPLAFLIKFWIDYNVVINKILNCIVTYTCKHVSFIWILMSHDCVLFGKQNSIHVWFIFEPKFNWSELYFKFRNVIAPGFVAFIMCILPLQIYQKVYKHHFLNIIQ